MLALAFCLWTAAVTLEPVILEDGPLEVMTTFHPTTYFAQRIGGDAVKVTCPLPEDADPAFWQPDREQIAKYQAADLVIVNGASFETWVDKTSLPDSRLVDTTRSFRAEFIEIHDAVTHSHGKEGAHSHVGTDGHTWLDPINAKAQAAAIAKAFAKKRPALTGRFEANLATLVADLDALDRQWKDVAKVLSKQLVIASHPAYNYPARRYGFEVFSLDFDPQEMPSPEQIDGLKKALAIRPAKWLLWESEPLPEIAKRLEEATGLKALVIEPGENPGSKRLAAGEHFLAIQQANLKKLSDALRASD